jgi:prophage regulatory protein
VGLKRSSIYRYVAEGRFPHPIRVGIRGVRWRLSDVLAWRASIGE